MVVRTKVILVNVYHRSNGQTISPKHIDYFMVDESVRFLFTSCEESQTNE